MVTIGQLGAITGFTLLIFMLSVAAAYSLYVIADKSQ